VVGTVTNEELSLSSSEPSNSSLCSYEKKTEKKIKFDTKMYFLKIKGTGHLIAKKDEGLKCTSQKNLRAPTYVTHVFHLRPLFFNSTSLNIKMQLDANLG
jgi:hypothetical protein